MATVKSALHLFYNVASKFMDVTLLILPFFVKRDIQMRFSCYLISKLFSDKPPRRKKARVYSDIHEQSVFV